MSLGQRDALVSAPTKPSRREWAAALLLAIVAVGITAYLARDLWFTRDEWEFLANRSALDLNDLTRPFGGHWVSWSVVLLQSLYKVFGVDFWPWYYAPRLLLHTLLVLFVWRVMRHRGADPLVALLALASLLVLGASGFQRALQVGNWTVFASVIVVALVIDRRPDEPTTRDRLLVAGALMVAVLGNGYAVAAIGAISLVLLLTRRLLVWLPSLLPALAAYGTWYLVYRDDLEQRPEPTLSALAHIPIGSFRVVRTAIESASPLPRALAGLTVLALAGWILVLVVHRRLTLFDTLVLTTAGVSLVLLNLQRIAPLPEAADRVRYGYGLTIMLTLGLAPHVPALRSTAARAGAVVVGLALVAANVRTLDREIDARVVGAQANRLVAVAAAGMIDAGEPVVGARSVLFTGLDTSELTYLVDDGYHPEPLPSDQPGLEDVEGKARGALRMGLVAASRLPGGPATAPSTTAPVDADGCVDLADGPVEAIVGGRASLTVIRDPDATATLVWEDEFGRGVRLVGDDEADRDGVVLAAPVSTAELTLEGNGGDVVVCGFEP